MANVAALNSLTWGHSMPASETQNTISRMSSVRGLFTRVLAGAVALALPVNASAACLQGINLAGAEFGSLGGAVGVDYSYPTARTIAYFAQKGLNSVRLPFRWERLQPVLNGPLDSGELARLTTTVKSVRANGMTVILDVHNYARYRDNLIGSNAVPNSAFANFWSQLSAHFANQDKVVFGLMNEPHNMKVKSWLTSANIATAAIRETGAKNLILVPGSTWTGAHSWQSSTDDGNNGKTMLGFVDPDNNYAFEVHQYFDQDYSGTSASCYGSAGALTGLKSFTGWLNANGKRGYLGEFGTGNSDACLSALSDALTIVKSNPDVWTGWAYWAAGDRWPASYILSVQPVANRERLQMGSIINALLSPDESCPALTVK